MFLRFTARWIALGYSGWQRNVVFDWCYLAGLHRAAFGSIHNWPSVLSFLASTCSVGLALRVTALFFFSGDFSLASVLLGGLSYGSVGADFRAFPARRISLGRFGVAMSADEYYRCVLSDSCHLSRLHRAGLGCIGFDYSSVFPCGFGFVKCRVPLPRNFRFARRRPAFFLVFGICDLGLPSVLLGDARYRPVSAEFRAFAAQSTRLLASLG